MTMSAWVTTPVNCFYAREKKNVESWKGRDPERFHLICDVHEAVRRPRPYLRNVFGLRQHIACDYDFILQIMWWGEKLSWITRRRAMTKISTFWCFSNWSIRPGAKNPNTEGARQFRYGARPRNIVTRSEDKYSIGFLHAWNWEKARI